MCNKDCWSCELEGCPYELYESTRIEREIQKERRLEGLDNANRLRDRKIARDRWLRKNKEKQREYQKSYNDSIKGKESKARHRLTDKYAETTRTYKNTENFRESIKKYQSSEKGKATSKRYRNSEKGKATDRRYRQTESFKTKNRENCAKYYQLHKEELKAKARERRRLKKEGAVS